VSEAAVFLFGGLVAVMCLAAASVLLGGERTKRLIRDLRGRALWQVSGLYLVASWVALQVVDVLADNYGLPDWFAPLALALIVVGLPVALAVAFVQDRSRGPGASDKQHAAAGSEAAGRLLTWQNVFVVGAIALGLWGAIATGWLLTGGKGVATAWLLVGDRGAVTVPAAEEVSREVGGATIAVLPFENLSIDQEIGQFVDGIHVDVLAALSRIEGLSVVSRRSVQHYALGADDARTIAAGLGATLILEGSVRRAADRVRVVVHLIDGSSNAQLWSGTYDREVGLENPLAIQSDIAERITRQLEAELGLPALDG